MMFLKFLLFSMILITTSLANASLYQCPHTPLNLHLGDALWDGGRLEVQGEKLHESKIKLKKNYYYLFNIKSWDAFGIGRTQHGDSIIECCHTTSSDNVKEIILCAKKKIASSYCEFKRRHKKKGNVVGFECKTLINEK